MSGTVTDTTADLYKRIEELERRVAASERRQSQIIVAISEEMARAREEASERGRRLSQRIDLLAEDIAAAGLPEIGRDNGERNT